MAKADLTPRETERLCLRIMSLSDAPFLYKLMNSEKWIRNIGDTGVPTIEDAQKYIQDKMHQNIWSKGFANYLMIDRSLGRPVGTCSLHNREGIDSFDIGCALFPEFEKNGYAKEGVLSMINLAFDNYHQVRVSAITSMTNTQSYVGLEKLGFIFKRLIKLPYSEEKMKLYQYNRKV
ncbi:MAG: ribosomal-protein-alanine N-acetyltransferase [Cyclobacteriaceae bacterium]|jgi:RimJ/RimL family protein N-acetyltransferase